MKYVVLIFILFFIISCSSSRLDRKIEDESWDSLAEETYLRWDEKRLTSNMSSQDEVVSCYQGRGKEALRNFKRDYLIKSESPYYWLHIGNCYFMEELWLKAEFYYRMSLSESKNPIIKSIALNNLGLIHLKFEQWEQGREFLKQSFALAPKLKVPRYNLGQLYLQFGFYDKAIEVFSGIPLFHKRDVDIYFSFANAYLFKGDLLKASEYFKLIPPLYFRREDIASTYALYLIKMGDMKSAKIIMNDRNRSGVPELTVISKKIESLLLQRMKEE